MDSKSIFASKTLWLNLLGPLFAWLGSKGLALTPEQQLAFIGIVMSGANIVVRLFTSQPVHVTAPPSAFLVAAMLGSLALAGCITPAKVTAIGNQVQADLATAQADLVAAQSSAATIVTTGKLVVNTLACQAQSVANLVGQGASDAGDKATADKASEISKKAGGICLKTAPAASST